MLSKAFGEAMSSQGEADDERDQVLPHSESDLLRSSNGATSESKHSGSTSASKDKIRCLDGLRGVACLLVFNYHFLWPWSPVIMLGYGAWPLQAIRPFRALSALPIICLLQRGRPMVAIFFAISGYVISRHILRAIHNGRLDIAYQKLASSTFRRAFRLFIPPTLSMLIVAILAQLGAFRSEKAIFTGPDSVYINGSVTIATQYGGPCSPGTYPVDGMEGVASFLGVEDPGTLNNETSLWTDITLCLNQTSQLQSAFDYAALIDFTAPTRPNRSSVYPDIQILPTKGDSSIASLIEPKDDSVPPSLFSAEDVDAPVSPSLAPRTTFSTIDQDKLMTRGLARLRWHEFGGSWEEHPIQYEYLSDAIGNLTKTYVEWVNPYNLAHYHPRYDPHTFTIPIEYRDSLLVYLFLLGTAAVKVKRRLLMGTGVTLYSLYIGRWDMCAFMGGAVLSDLDMSLDEGSVVIPAFITGSGSAMIGSKSLSRSTILRWVLVVLGLHCLSYPDSAGEYTPGFVWMSWMTSKYYAPVSRWCFWQPVGAVMLLPGIIYSPFLRSLFEGRTAQYLGKISFSFYLIHGPVLHGLGFWLMPRLFDAFGQPLGFMVGWVILLGLTLYLSNLWYRNVDIRSMSVGKRVEAMMTT